MPLRDEEHSRKRVRTRRKRREKTLIVLHPQRWAWLRFDANVHGAPGGYEHGKLYRRKETEANNVWWDLVDQEEAIEKQKPKPPVKVVVKAEEEITKIIEMFNAPSKVIFAFTPESPLDELKKEKA